MTKKEQQRGAVILPLCPEECNSEIWHEFTTIEMNIISDFVNGTKEVSYEIILSAFRSLIWRKPFGEQQLKNVCECKFKIYHYLSEQDNDNAHIYNALTLAYFSLDV